MYRRYNRKRRENEGGEIEKIIFTLFSLGLMYLAFTFYINKEKFWYQIYNYIFPLIGLIILSVIGYLFYLKKIKEIKPKVNNSFI